MSHELEKKINELINSFGTKTPKQMRTIRNNLNNRIKSFEEEMKFGKKLPVLSASHMFFGFELKELKMIKDATMKVIKAHEKL